VSLANSAHHCSTFSLHAHRAPRDLHSFPTRRSSDLDSSTASHAAAMSATRSTASSGPKISSRNTAESGGRSGPLLAVERVADMRSEEHTSELQSQSNLVCRLLLEKKKKEPKSMTNVA